MAVVLRQFCNSFGIDRSSEAPNCTLWERHGSVAGAGLEGLQRLGASQGVDRTREVPKLRSSELHLKGPKRGPGPAAALQGQATALQGQAASLQAQAAALQGPGRGIAGPGKKKNPKIIRFFDPLHCIAPEI